MRAAIVIAIAVGAVAAAAAQPARTGDRPARTGDRADRAGDRAARLANADASQALAERALAAGEYQRGQPFAEAALRDREALLPAGDPRIADSALVLGVMRGKSGDRVAAARLLARALAIRERALPKHDPRIADALVAYGAFLRDAGDFVAAEPLLVRALAIAKGARDRDRSPGLARALEALARLRAERDDPRCEAMLRRAIALHEQRTGPDSVEVARAAGALADLLARRGDLARAEPLYQRAMAIYESTGDLGDPRRAAALLDLARVRFARGGAAEALALANLAYTIDAAILGEGHPFVARDLVEIAALARAGGDAARAERYTWRALTIRERTLGADHPDVGEALAALAASYAARGETATAIKLVTRALGIFRRSLGSKHPAVAAALTSLARLALVERDVARALAALTEAGEIREASLELLLGAGSERQKRLYLATLAAETDATISLFAQFAPADPAARRLALVTLLRRKGRVLDTMTDTFGALRGRMSAADAAVLDRLAGHRARLASTVLRGPAANQSATDHARAIAALEAQVQELEAAVSARSAAFGAGRTRVTVEAVRAAIPDGARLVELVSYQPLGTADEARRYGAFVVGRTGDPRWVDLGPAAAIDALVAEARAAFADPEVDPRPVARRLDAAVMQPVRAVLGDARQLLLSPDGALNLVPFAAMLDEHDRFLVERYAITYLTTGRDLLRIAGPQATAATGAMVIADPDFGAEAGAAAPDQRRSFDLGDVMFTPLPGTADEAAALAGLLDEPRLLTGAGATEGALKRARAPLLLHVATHGFFLDDVVDPAAGARGLVRIPGRPAEDPVLRAEQPSRGVTPASLENPLLRSGLALAGANRRASGADDGVLTALEAAGLDLWGTQLVVLSACETGVGEVRNGEGVYGLRRALVIAGAGSQVISLWEVDDEATRDLMIGYYERLAAGAGRSEALRATQLAMLANPARRHPYFWASFIPSGDWRPLRRPVAEAAAPPKVARGARGCACDAGGAPARDSLVLGLGLVWLVVARRRRRAAAAATAIGLVALGLGVAPARAGIARHYTLQMPATRLEVTLAGDPGDWTVTDASAGRFKWDAFAWTRGPDLAIRVQPVIGPTRCELVLGMRHLAAMQAARVVARPPYLPAELYPEVLEHAARDRVTVMACADLPDGAMTAIIHYRGTAWDRDAALVTPVLRAYAAAAAWGPGTPITAERTVTLPATGIALRLPGGWNERHAAQRDVVVRAQVGKPALAVAVAVDRPAAWARGRRPKGPGDDCAFWAQGLRLAPKPDTQLVPRPAFVPASWHAEVALTLAPRRDRLTLCLDTPGGRWLATVEYFGAWTAPDVAEAGVILGRIAARP